jgi:hypothetical protein
LQRYTGACRGYGPPKNKPEMIKLLRSAVERVVIFFDTAVPIEGGRGLRVELAA